MSRSVLHILDLLMTCAMWGFFGRSEPWVAIAAIANRDPRFAPTISLRFALQLLQNRRVFQGGNIAGDVFALGE
jgi:hypothetical protein